VPTVPIGNNADSVITAENSFSATAQGARAGTSPSFARADHTHGLPPNPIPPHVANITAHAQHTIAGDVTQTVGNTFIDKLQGKTVNAQNPNDGDILQFNLDKNAWLTVPNNSSGGADVVQHPAERGQYFIVAAGILQLSKKLVAPSYNKLRIVESDGNSVLLTFGPDVAASPDDGYIKPSTKFTYIVKGHSFGKSPAYLHVESFDAKGILVRFIPTDNNDPIEQAMIEISLFGSF
jgi:hypothetical protein